jgi:hypothetical protein
MTEDKPKAAAPAADKAQEQKGVTWNTSSLHSSYANFCNANSTREEVVLNFGVNKAWDRTREASEIELNHRIVLSPFAAKRLSQLLSRLMQEYEARYGTLSE